MPVVKSTGVTTTERLLADLCERSFLKLWSYPNPFKEDKKELCDLLAVFDDHIFIFFDRENLSLEKEENDPQVNWNRWKKKTIDKQINTAIGAERYIKSGKSIFLDKDSSNPFPIAFDPKKVVIHKIIVAHGAKEACEKFSDNNVSGSIGMIYGDTDEVLPFPFMIGMSKEHLVHIFDSHNLPIIFYELDTFYDLSTYLVEKEKAIRSMNSLSYCGEEDLLAHYLLTYDETENRHYIGSHEHEYDSLMIGEGEWEDFTKLGLYEKKNKANEVSYLWDELIQKTCQNTLDETLLGSSSPLRGKSAIHEMAKEPRFHRRFLSERIIQSIEGFPESSQGFMRNLSFLPSFYEGKGYVFLQVKIPTTPETVGENRKKRQVLLEIACASAKNKFPNLKKIIGIAIYSPKYSQENGEDLLLLECEEWPDEHKTHYEQLNKDWGFFQSDSLKMQTGKVSEFPQ